MQNIYAILSLRFLAAVADSGVVIPSAVFGTRLSSFKKKLFTATHERS